MKILPAGALAATVIVLLLVGGPFAPAAAFVAAGDDGAARRAETVQFFDRDRRRNDRPRRRDRRIEQFRPPPPGGNNDIILERRQQRRQDQDRALDAVRRGQVLPLGGIIRSVQSYCPGTFLDASLRRRGNQYAYRVAILRPSGTRIIFLVDAASGAILRGQCR